jgi:cell surface protein SprA
LTNYPEFNQNYTQVKTKKLDYTAQLEPLTDLKIDINAERNYSTNYSEQFDVVNGVYNSRSPYSTGNFNISTILIKTAFSSSDANQSQVFDQFRENRFAIATRLAEQHYGSTSYPLDTEGYPIGFGKNSQRVLASCCL